jgi:hypothetical protein
MKNKTKTKQKMAKETIVTFSLVVNIQINRLLQLMCKQGRVEVSHKLFLVVNNE